VGGEVVGRGRTADVVGDGPDRVIRTYRDGRDAAPEVRVLRHLHEVGYPVPRVFDAAGPVMVVERVTGPTLLRYCLGRPWRAAAGARLLRSLLDRLAGVAVPDGLPEPFGAGGQLLHLDLHPDNVLLGRAGPVVIDWPNAARGPAAADVAQSWLLIVTSDPPVPAPVRPVAGALQRSFADHVLPTADPTRGWIPLVARRRLGDPNVTETERRRLIRLGN